MYENAGDKIEQSFHWQQYDSEREGWEAMVAELKRLNPGVLC